MKNSSYVFLLFLVAVFFVLPKNIFAETSQISLSQDDTWILLNVIQSQISREMSPVFNLDSFKPEEQAAIFLVRKSIRKETFKFLVSDLTENIAKSYLKVLLSIYAPPNAKDIFDKFESESRKAALKQLKDWLNQNQIKTVRGELKFSYEDYNKNLQEATFQYLMIYYPLGSDYAEVRIEFYSGKLLFVPFATWDTPWDIYTFLEEGKTEINPFIIKIKTGVKRFNSGYIWNSDSNTKIEVSFPNEVPDIRSIEEKSPLSKLESFFNKIKSLADEFSLWIHLPQLPKQAQTIKDIGTETWDLFSNLKNPSLVDEEHKEESFDGGKDEDGVVKEQKNDVLLEFEEGVVKGLETVANEESDEKILEDEEEEQYKEENTEDKEILWCESNKQPSQDKIVINEVAWMGTTNSSNDEWIELKNISNKSVNLENWQLFDGKKQIKIIFDAVTIPANNFYLLERTDDTSVPFVNADLIYVGSLSNKDESLYLFDNNCNLRDIVMADSDWPAGSNLSSEKRTMERDEDIGGWHTYSGYQNNGIWGTPKKGNSFKVDISSKSEGSSDVEDNPEQTSGGSTYIIPKIIITEIQVEGENASQDFIEIYNPYSEEKDISRWQLKKRTQGGAESSINVFPENIIIPGKGYFLWASSKDDNYSNFVSADISSTSYLTENNSIALFDRYKNLVDAVAWGRDHQNPFFEASPFNENPRAYQSIERKTDSNGYIDNNDNLNDFRIQNCPNPKNKVIECYSSNQGGGGAENSGDESNAEEKSSEEDDEEIKLLINEIQIAPISERFVEIYNPNDEIIDLTGWYMQRKTGSGNLYSFISSTNFEGKKIAPHSYFLITKMESPFVNKADIVLDITLTENNTLIFKDSNRNIIDKIGWGNAQDFEESPAQNPLLDQTIGRKWSGSCQDTDNNSNDFEAQVPTPKSENMRDLVAPDTEITSGPPILTNQNQALFYFKSTEENCEFECKIYNDWQDCESPKEYILEDGNYNFFVRAIDSFGNYDESPSQHTWTIDTKIESPKISLFDLSSESNNPYFYTNQSKVGVIVSVSDTKEGLEWLLLEENKKPVFNTSDWQKNLPDTFDFSTPCSDGLKTVHVWTKDKAGNVSELGNKDTIILDRSAPEVSFAVSSLQTDIEFTLSWLSYDYVTSPSEAIMHSDIDKFFLKYTTPAGDGIYYQAGGGWIEWLVNEILELANNISNIVLRVKDEKTYNFEIQTRDKAGNLSSLEKASVNIDVPKPILSVSSDNFEFREIKFELKSENQILIISNFGKSVLEWQFITPSIDGWVNFSSFSDNVLPDESSEISVSVNISDLEPGQYQNKIQLTSNDVSKDVQINLDYKEESLPQIEILSPVPNQIFIFPNDEISISGTSNAGNFISVLDSELSGIQANENGEWEIQGIKLQEGENIFHLISRNQSGKEAKEEITVFLEKPVLEISPSSFDFETVLGEDPESQFLIVKNTGSGDLNWNISSSIDWLSFQSVSGIIPAHSSEIIEVLADTSGLEQKYCSLGASFSVESDNASNGSYPVQVSLEIASISDLDVDGIVDAFDPETIISGTVTLSSGEYIFKDLTLESGGKLILESNLDPDFEGLRGVKIKANNLTIDDSSFISASELGYSSREGPGAGKICCLGGSYGGRGGQNSNDSIYGSLIKPVDLGSGGGGGAGGGVIILEIDDILEVNGSILADGESNSLEGGGSGGSIWITAGVLEGSGTISANGGNGRIQGGACGGGGGGGRIAVEYNTSTFLADNIECKGGDGRENGGAGTIFLKSSTQEYGDLIIDSKGEGGATILMDNEYVFDSLEVLNSAHLYLPENLTAGSLNVENGSVLEFASTTTISVVNNFSINSNSSLVGLKEAFLNIIGGNLEIRSGSKINANIRVDAENLTIDDSSFISVSELGYPLREGPGAGKSCDIGGSYGGKGGWNSATSTYGSLNEPVDLGSGGAGGAGGGAIILNISNTLEMNGSIFANGEPHSTQGGGSGGTVYIKTDILKGLSSSIISTNGGNGRIQGGSRAGGGGGGRIAVEYNTSTFTADNIECKGGVGRAGGQNGTVVINGTQL